MNINFYTIVLGVFAMILQISSIEFAWFMPIILLVTFINTLFAMYRLITELYEIKIGKGIFYIKKKNWQKNSYERILLFV